MNEPLGMIDIGKKDKTKREACAQAKVILDEEIVERIKQNTIPKGNVLETALIAGIMAAKRTDDIIPLCHNIEIECVNIDFTLNKNEVIVESYVKSFAKTGVEMEAMLACSIASLSIYDMCKMFSKSIEITDICLIKKTGGKSGDYHRAG